MIELFKQLIKNLSPNKSLVPTPLDSTSKTINGSFQASECTIDEKLIINGAATLGQNAIIKKPITINGQLQAAGATIENDLFANGSTKISNSNLQSKAHFRGSLTAQDCHFLDSITLLAHDASFINCQVNQIEILSLPYVQTSQTIRLSNGCVITGNIIFQSQAGEVLIDPSSQIHGKVIGGKAIHL